MNRLIQLYNKLGLNKENGLFLQNEAELWFHKFPYRISRILRDVIKPEAFFCIYNNYSKESDNHPNPINQSFILFFDNPSPDKEKLINNQIINFGLAQAIFINRRDTLDLYHGDKFLLPKKKELIKIKSSKLLDDFSNMSFINQLRGTVLKRFKSKGTKSESKLIDKFLLENITDARRILVAKDGLKLPTNAANRLIGRLLFVSYLIDRGVTFSDQNYINGKNKFERKSEFKNIILKKSSLYGFFKYLNKKYNGDIFPLVEQGYNEEAYVTEKHLEVLHHLFSCSKFFLTGGKYEGRYYVQPSLFDLYDFEIIPVELISSIYENFIGNTDENKDIELTKQKEIKAYYTPPYIVDFILSHTIVPFLEADSKEDSNCKVLDPACGSGIFLVETLRKIIEKELSITNNKKISDSRLWKLIKSNIYGIDIDSDAIDISIFSLYITLLDYKQPPEIESFRFQKLKNENFFGGIESDFFNTNHLFNTVIKDLDFIIGNSPWGIVPQSAYLEYIKNRNEQENKNKKSIDKLVLQLGDNDICQAFLVRTSDFSKESNLPLCSFIISSKVLYNTSKSSKTFRNYFLNKFNIKQVVELSPVNNKIRGGKHIFENARQPAAIITFTPNTEQNSTKENIIRHITVKPNRFFLEYRTIVIEKHDVKNIKQEYFIEKFGGHDWLWKVLVYGNALDIHFMRRLKNKDAYKTANQYFEELGYEWNTGLKLKDGDKKFDAGNILNYKYLDAKLEFQQFKINPSKTLKEELKLKNIENGMVGYLPELKFFEGDKLLIKSGIILEPVTGENFFNAISAFSNKKVSFSSTVCSIKPKSNNKNAKSFLSSLVGLFNSKLFTYFLLCSNSSAGIERSRLHFKESFEFPVVIDEKISEMVLEIPEFNSWVSLHHREEIEKRIIDIYQINETEQDLIDYAINISIPVLLRDQNSFYLKSLNIDNNSDKKFITDYVNIFLKAFKRRFDRINKCLYAEILYSDYLLRINFYTIPKAKGSKALHVSKVDNTDLNVLFGDLGIYNICKNLFVQQDVRGFTESSFYIIKPNERKLWHKAVAHLDVLEFEEELIKAEINKLKLIRHK